jgi:hypothetical protein
MINVLHCIVYQKLRLPSHIRSDDGLSDTFGAAFSAIDAHNTGDITLDEFLDFLRANSEEYATEGHNRRINQSQQAVDASGSGWESGPAKREIDPVRVSTASEDILASGHKKKDASPRQSRWESDEDDADARGGMSSRASSPEQSLQQHDESWEEERFALRQHPDMHSSSPAPVATGRHNTSHHDHGKSTGVSRDHPHHQHQHQHHMAASYDSSFRHGGGDAPGRPPLHKGLSAGNVLAAGGLAASIDAGSVKHLEKHFPPPPTELGTAMNVILEGYLDKKSTNLGQWQKVN